MFFKMIFVDKMTIINHVEINSYQFDQKFYIIFTCLSQEERLFRILSNIFSQHWR